MESQLFSSIRIKQNLNIYKYIYIYIYVLSLQNTNRIFFLKSKYKRADLCSVDQYNRIHKCYYVSLTRSQDE